jgi:type IV secretion system protein VirD4
MPRTGRALIATASAACVLLISASAATQMLGARFAHQHALGPRATIGDLTLYPPLAILDWSKHWSSAYPRAFAVPKLVFGIGLLGAGFILLLGLRSNGPEPGVFGVRAWGKRSDALTAGLFAAAGVILGKFKGEILAYDGPHHLLLTGGTRSGKTRGSVVPTLLAWPHSIVVLDLKGELHSGDARVGFPGTAGWRARVGDVIRFDPTSTQSDRFNLIDTIRPGAQEVRDAQNLVELISDPYGDGRFQDFWDRAAKQIVAGLVLHVAYAEPPEKKTLHRVFELLARFDDTIKAMEATFHRWNPSTSEPETHPEVRRAAHSYASYHEKLRAGIKATAESYLGLFADPLVQANTAHSTFRISDLMCGERPVTLYLCWPPNDSRRIKPLMRLLVGAVLRDLMEHQERAADGRDKQRPLLLLLDEFPQLGKLDLFEQSMGAMAGYGLRAYIVTQSLHQISQAYGRFHTILDNCNIVTSFAATDVETAETISKLAGDIYEMRPQETWSGKRQVFGLDHRAVTYREERRPLLLPSEVRRLPDSDELIFVTGVKPLRAQKLRYDEETIFRDRLTPLAPLAARPALPSPWAAMRALGQRKAPATREGAIERAIVQHEPLRSRPRANEAQPDLLAILDAPASPPKPPSRFGLLPPAPPSDAGDAT